jgi:hypothetical protein
METRVTLKRNRLNFAGYGTVIIMKKCTYNREARLLAILLIQQEYFHKLYCNLSVQKVL